MNRHFEALPEPARRALGTAGLVYLVTTYDDGGQHHRTGRVQQGKFPDGTPCPVLAYGTSSAPELLLAPCWTNTVVAGVRASDGRHYYTPDNRPGSVPGVAYREEVALGGGVDYRVLPGRPRFAAPGSIVTEASK